MLQQKKLKANFWVEIPMNQQNNLEQYMMTTWRKKNQNIRNYIILEILDFQLISKQQLTRGKDFNSWNWSTWMQIEFNGYVVYPGMCIDLNDYGRIEGESYIQDQSIVSQKIILSPVKTQKIKKLSGGSFLENIRQDDMPCIREYIKTMDKSSTIYQVSICQDYVGFYFLLKQIHAGYQACDLDLSSGAKEYEYDKEIIEPAKSKVQIQKKTYERIYPMLDEYELISQYTLDDFKQWQKEKKNIIVPRIRLDKTIMVSKKEMKKETQNDYGVDVYEKLFWLIQLQQKFINQMLDKNETTK